MAISGDYPRPVTVNGYSCKNCTDVGNAKKHIDPAHPKDGPYGVAKSDADKANVGKTDPAGAVAGNDKTPAITFGGQLAALAQTARATTSPPPSPAPSPGLLLDVSA